MKPTADITTEEQDFESWLKENGLYEEYINNPSSRNDISCKYHLGTEYELFKNPKMWFEWAQKDFESAEKYFPKAMAKFREMAFQRPDFEVAAYICRKLEEFDQFKKDLTRLTGDAKRNRIQDRFDTLIGILDANIDKPLVRDTINKYGKEFITQLSYCASELENTSSDEDDNKSKLTLRQIALLHYYQRMQITRENGDEIVRGYGHKSGDKLFQEYTYFSSRANRHAMPPLCTEKKLRNKIVLFQSVLDILPDSKKDEIISDIAKLEEHYNNEYQ